MTEHRHTRSAVISAALAITVMPRAVNGQTFRTVAGQPGATIMQKRCAFDRHSFTAKLIDNPSARDFASMLPLDLSIENYAGNEKIAYLPRKLSEVGSGPFSNEAPGDLCYFAPWGNLAFFYAGYRYSSGLIRLGRLDDGIDPLLTKGTFPLRIELVA